MPATDHDWTKPAAMAIPKEGYFELERGRYGPVFPRTPACYGFSIIAKVKEGREDAIREHGKTIQAAITETPEFLAPLRLHYLRWVLFDIGDGLTFQYQGIFDTDFDKYTEDAVQLFGQSGITTVFTNLEGFPEDWKENPDSFVKFVREHHFPSFLEYGEYPYVTADEVKKALRLRLHSPSCSTRCSSGARWSIPHIGVESSSRQWPDWSIPSARVASASSARLEHALAGCEGPRAPADRSLFLRLSQ